MLSKVVSGGQNGVDQAALRAAKANGIVTGGWIPKGCVTLDGPRPEFLAEYSLCEHSAATYPPRTEANVRDSDATIRFAKKFHSPGEICTLKAVKWYNKPHLDIPAGEPLPYAEVLAWLEQNQVGVLNVAGNSESTSPGIGNLAFEYFNGLFQEITRRK